MSCCECNPEAIFYYKDEVNHSGISFLSIGELEIYYWQHLGEICQYCELPLVAPKWFGIGGNSMGHEERWWSAIKADPIGDIERAIQMWEGKGN